MPPAPRTDVRLVPLGPEHAAAMLKWVSDPDVADGVGLRDREPTLEKTIAWIERASSDETMRAFAILASDDHVGTIALDRIDSYLQTVRLSVYVGEARERGAGVGRTAVKLAVDRAFNELGLHKVWLTVHAENVRAIAAYLAVGFQIEGILRDEFLLAGRRVPALYLGLLRHDYLRGSDRA